MSCSAFDEAALPDGCAVSPESLQEQQETFFCRGMREMGEGHRYRFKTCVVTRTLGQKAVREKGTEALIKDESSLCNLWEFVRPLNQPFHTRGAFVLNISTSVCVTARKTLTLRGLTQEGKIGHYSKKKHSRTAPGA